MIVHQLQTEEMKEYKQEVLDYRLFFDLIMIDKSKPEKEVKPFY